MSSAPRHQFFGAVGVGPLQHGERASVAAKSLNGMVGARQSSRSRGLPGAIGRVVAEERPVPDSAAAFWCASVAMSMPCAMQGL